MPFKKPDFTIDDAFSESAEDKIRLYTRTSESVPLTEETIQVHSDLSIPAEEYRLKLNLLIAEVEKSSTLVLFTTYD